VRKISYAVPGAPVVENAPASQSVAAGRPATFSVTASGQDPLTYQWQRDGVDVPGATAATYTIDATTPADSGATYRVIVTNSLGSAASAGATLTVVVDQPPVAMIVTPKEGSFYNAGTILRFRGAATDAEDGKLPAWAFSWRIDFHHDTHLHPFYPETAGRRGGSVRIPAEGETSSNVWYRVHLTVTDSAGVSTSVFRDVLPHKADVTVQTSVPGLTINLDGQPTAAPFTFTGVVGLKRTLEAPATEVLNGVEYVFRGWGKRRKSLLSIRTPRAAQTYVARYDPATPSA
jgi:hypothetical protein